MFFETVYSTLFLAASSNKLIQSDSEISRLLIVSGMPSVHAIREFMLLTKKSLLIFSEYPHSAN